MQSNNINTTENNTPDMENNLAIRARKLNIPSISALIRRPDNEEELKEVVERWENMDEEERSISRMPLRELKQYAVSIGLLGVNKYTAGDKNELVRNVLGKYKERAGGSVVDRVAKLFYNENPRSTRSRRSSASSFSSISLDESASTYNSRKSTSKSKNSTSNTQSFFTGILYAVIGSAITGYMFYYKLSKLLDPPKTTREKLVPTHDEKLSVNNYPGRQKRYVNFK